jgi:type IV fimbrial biogenesis protein FimT
MSHRYNAQGMTLIELMFTLSLLAILMMLAVPSFSGAIASNRLTTTTNDLYTSLLQAKSEAIKRGKRVTVCVSADGTTCSNATNWNTGWITFVDATRTSATLTSIDAGESIIAITPATDSTILIPSNMPYVSYAADGGTRQMSGVPMSGRIRVCNQSSALSDAERFRDVTITTVGRVVLSRTPPPLASPPDTACPL